MQYRLNVRTVTPADLDAVMAAYNALCDAQGDQELHVDYAGNFHKAVMTLPLDKLERVAA